MVKLDKIAHFVVSLILTIVLAIVIKSVETEVPRNKKRITACKKLIGSLDTAYAEKQEIDNRIKRLEESNAETNKLLNQILTKLK